MSFALSAEGRRIYPEHEKEREDRDDERCRELRPQRELHEDFADRAEEFSRFYFEPVHEAGGGVELSGDHAEAEEDGSPSEYGEPSEGDAHEDERDAADHIEELRGVESSSVLSLMVEIAVFEALSGFALYEAVPAFFYAVDHRPEKIP